MIGYYDTGQFNAHWKREGQEPKLCGYIVPMIVVIHTVAAEAEYSIINCSCPSSCPVGGMFSWWRFEARQDDCISERIVLYLSPL